MYRFMLRFKYHGKKVPQNYSFLAMQAGKK